MELFFHKINIVRHIACHIYGPEHSVKHHKRFGAFIFAMGMALYENSHICGSMLEVCVKGLAIILHAFGLAPYLDSHHSSQTSEEDVKPHKTDEVKISERGPVRRSNLQVPLTDLPQGYHAQRQAVTGNSHTDTCW